MNYPSELHRACSSGFLQIQNQKVQCHASYPLNLILLNCEVHWSTWSMLCILYELWCKCCSYVQSNFCFDFWNIFAADGCQFRFVRKKLPVNSKENKSFGDHIQQKFTYTYNIHELIPLVYFFLFQFLSTWRSLSGIPQQNPCFL